MFIKSCPAGAALLVASLVLASLVGCKCQSDTGLGRLGHVDDHLGNPDQEVVIQSPEPWVDSSTMSEDRAELLLSLLNHAQRPIKDALLAKLMFLPSPQNLAEWHRCNSSTVCHEGLKKELRLIVTLAQNAHTIEHLAAHFIEATPAIQSPSAKDLPTKRVLLGPKFLCYFGHAPTSASYQDIFLSMVHTPTFSAGWLCASEQVSFE